MRILLYGINFAPELTGIGKYSGEMASWLCQRGHQVDVITAPPYYPQWQIDAAYAGLRYRREVSEQGRLSVTRCPLYVPARVTGLKRLVHHATFALSSCWQLARACRQKPDVMLVVIPSLAAVPLALLMGRMSGVPVWLHVQDFEVDAAFGLGMLGKSGGRAERWAKRIEAFLMKRCARVSSISPRMVERLAGKGVSSERQVLFPNWVDATQVRPQAEPRSQNPYRIEWCVDAKGVVVLYSGNMGEKQGLETVIEAARQLQDVPGLVFVLAGSGAARARLEALASGLANVRWLPLQPAERLNEFLNAADIHVLPQRADAADLVMPSKLTGMLASGRCTLGTAGRDTQLGQVLDRCGVRVEAGDVHALAEAVRVLAADPERRETLGRAARVYAEQHLAQEPILSGFEGQLLRLAGLPGGN